MKINFEKLDNVYHFLCLYGVSMICKVIHICLYDVISNNDNYVVLVYLLDHFRRKRPDWLLRPY